MIYFVRHGQTAQNREKRLQGRSDVPLNEAGEEQARALGLWFREQGVRFDVVYASPLGRAIETARLIVGDEVRIFLDTRLIEMDYGPYEGMDFMAPTPEVTAFFRDLTHTPAPEGMEQLTEVTARLGDFLEEHKAECEEKCILLSTHAVALKGALEYLTPESQGAYWSKNMGNCAVYRVDCTDGEYSVPVEVTRGKFIRN